MTLSPTDIAWREPFDALAIDIEPTERPDNADGGGRDWFQTLTRFSRRGFLRLLVAPGESDAVVFAQLAVPGADADYATTLAAHLTRVSNANWSADTATTPWVLRAPAVALENLQEVVRTFTRVADHILAAEDGARAHVLAQEFTSGAGASNSSAIEKNTAERSEKTAKTETPAPTNSPFETIGTGSTSNLGAPDEVAAKPDAPRHTATGDAMLDGFRVAVRNGVLHADLDLTNPIDRSTENRLLAALARTLSARFDITLLSQELNARGTGATISLAMRANVEADSGTVAADVGRYFERLKKFNGLGMSLLDTLMPGATSTRAPSQPSRSSQPAQPARHAAPRRTSAAQPEPASNGDEVVLAFASGAPTAAATPHADGLQPGNFRDPRIRRDDATTPLVDVVLRHPGYSDKNMSQVLSILLDITHYDAARLVAQAPCLIGWGVSHERARDFKRVIEGAGGRVTLVEPDSLH